ncbi:potassium channel family protein [uncultured Christiangramia sp.]|uniref:potassium channel family protein n=1 Tax=Christiangramia sp. 3-2217-3z TaxID=3417564 RepID=UPI002633930B|nr:potassium channel family protein [uncultured Christiangramia sp.]|tara:strand:+ start:1490 stop:2494 length:1005 start_codon:yes stop_codon:yes gene_type:complete
MAIFLALGLIIYIATVLDILQTTLSMQGGGWLTSRYSHFFWKLFLFLSGKNGKSKILAHAGYFLLIAIVLIWVMCLWLSLVCILYSQPGAIIDSTTKVAANIWQIIYYSGFTLSTLGMGDYVPSGDIWRVLTSIYSFTGLILLTMSVTYFIPVLSAVIDQRKLGITLGTLGSSPEEIVLTSWNGKNFEPLISKVDALSDSIIKYSQQHRAYPVIHYFHNNKEKNAIILQLARLYEALLIISNQIDKDKRPEFQKIKPLLIAYENYFEVLSEVTHMTVEPSAPPVPSIKKLLDAKLIINLSKNGFSGEIEHNRRTFMTLVQQDGWNWELVDIKNS